MEKNKYECKKCNHRVNTVAGIRGHIWSKHRNKGKDKTPIRRHVDYIMTDEYGHTDESVTTPQGLECLSDATLAVIVESDIREHGQLYKEGTIALNELYNRDPKFGG
ncbi:MAG: hypothetical protein ACETWQ_22525 [Phycisphaerae bacterium]